MAEGIKNKAIKGVGWSFADNILNQGVTFLVGLVLARLLSPEEYGLIGIIAIFIAVFNSIVDSGFSNALIRKNDAGDADYNTVFITNMVMSVLLFCVMFLCAPLIASFFNRPQLIPLTKVMASVVIINAFAIIQRTILVKKVDFKTQTKVSAIASVASGVVGIGMASGGLGVWSLVGQQLSRQFLNSLFLWVFAKWYPRLQFSVKSFKELFNFGWKLMVSGLIDTVWREIYQVIIGKFYSPATLGQYTRAHQFGSIFSTNLTAVVQRVSYPVLSEIQGDLAKLKNAYKKVIKVTMLITFSCMLGLAAIAEPMIVSLIGDQWLPAVPFLQILCFSMMLYPLHAINLNMLQVQGRSDLFLRLEIIKKMIAVVPLLLGIFVNIYLMLFGSVMTGFIAYYLNAFYSGKFLNYSIVEQVKDIFPSFIIALIMAVIVWGISFINLPSAALLAIQLPAGVSVIILLCEAVRLDSYLEIKHIALTFINKFRHGK
ncbi:MAG: lipopolysaccharide biosynthesis protein [Bacteroidales bacterium]|nr:lipopolysaccharide biosynthesis protein [Bacteroidales bacterium]